MPRPQNAETRESASEPLAALVSRLGHSFADPGLLQRALTHSSFAYEAQSGGEISDSASAVSVIDRGNEQMEFLGDAILGMAAAEWLYRRHGHEDEGRLTRLRAALVSRSNLCRVAKRLGLGSHLRLGRGEERSGGRHKAALLADALEAVIAAVYLDSGLAAAARFIDREIMSTAGEAGADLAEIEDWKSAVQEWLQARGEPRARYEVVEAGGPDHARLFTVQVLVKDEVLAESTARSKKQAEQECARVALRTLQERAAE